METELVLKITEQQAIELSKNNIFSYFGNDINGVGIFYISYYYREVYTDLEEVLIEKIKPFV